MPLDDPPNCTDESRTDPSLVNDAFAVAIGHVLIGGIITTHRCDSMPPRDGACHAPIAVVGPWHVRLWTSPRPRSRDRYRRGGRPCRRRCHPHRRAAGKHPFERSHPSRGSAGCAEARIVRLLSFNNVLDVGFGHRANERRDGRPAIIHPKTATREIKTDSVLEIPAVQECQADRHGAQRGPGKRRASASPRSAPGPARTCPAARCSRILFLH